MPTPLTLAPTLRPTTNIPTSLPTTATPTTRLPTTAMPTSLPTTATPTTHRPTTALPTSLPTTAKPTTARPTNRPTSPPTLPGPSCVETAGFFKGYLNGEWSASPSVADQFDRKIKIRRTTWDYKLWRDDDEWKISYLKKGNWKNHLGSCKADAVLDCDNAFSWSSPWAKFHDCSEADGGGAALHMEMEWFSNDGVDTHCFEEDTAYDDLVVHMTGLHTVLDDVAIGGDDDDGNETAVVFETQWCWNEKPLYALTLHVYDDENETAVVFETQWCWNEKPLYALTLHVYDDEQGEDEGVDVIPVTYMLQWTGVEWAIAENELISVAVDDDHYYGYNQRIAFCEQSELSDCVAHTWVVRSNFSAVAADEHDSDVQYQYQLSRELAVVNGLSEDAASKNGHPAGLIIGIVCGCLFVLMVSIFFYRYYATREQGSMQYQPMKDEPQIAMTS
eukprot:CAMPEP_0202726388 /NCGR_PEP_ID=MMETSP1385-20130828/184586_1 /ASSEMBLY_ACC=CAM_ASM_000861 /TAXON_ID=933848 /ORGANISM="Elphidium margaritaceum" /LENGTH=446 /DNA_ID=CAMNT_0049392607 /DNA_START=146 /DNA_END=1487 /DNA_ORIENTATION=+